MPHARQLTSQEGPVIFNMLGDSQDIAAIAIAVGRSMGGIYGVKNNPTKLEESPKTGTPRTALETSFCRMMQTSRSGHPTARIVKTVSSSPYSVRRIRHYKANDDNIRYKKCTSSQYDCYIASRTCDVSKPKYSDHKRLLGKIFFI